MTLRHVLRALVACIASCTSTVYASPYANRRVSDVLDELRGAGFVFIYSTHTVPAGLRITVEPVARGGVELAREILAPHGLMLLEAAPKIYSIARAAKTAGPRPPSADAYPLEELVVQTSRYTLSNDLATTATFLTQDQIKDLPQLAGETLRAVQRLPGSATNGFSGIGPVRGGEPGEVAIILDGLRLYEPFHLKNFLSPVSLLDSRLIDSVAYYSGGFPAIYGDRMSAVIEAHSIRPGQPRYFELGVDLFHASALGSVAFAEDRGRALLSYRRSNLGELAKFSETEFGEPNYQDAFGRLGYSLTERTRASFNVLVSIDTIEALRARKTQKVTAEYRNVYAWATLEHEWSEAASSRGILSYTDLSNDRYGRISEAARTAMLNDERTFHVLGLRWENSLDTDLLHHRFGLEGRRLWGQYRYVSDVSLAAGTPFLGSPALQVQRDLSPEPDGYEAVAYWDVRTDITDRWTFQGGLRFDTQTYDGSGDGAQWSPRLSALYALGRHSNLRVGWGRFYQPQGINELQVEDGIDRFNPVQSADHFIVGVDHAFATGLDLRIEAYRKRYRRLSPRFENMFDPVVLFPEAEFDRVMIDPDSARAYGIEALLRLRPHGSWSGWLSYAWSRAEDRIDGRDVPRSWDQRHALTLGVVWSKGPWTVSLANSYHSGWPRTPLRVEFGAGVPRVSSGVRNRDHFGSYNSLDLRVTRVFALSRGVLDVFAEVTNATSKANACCVQYRSHVNESGSVHYESDVDSWLPLVPSVGVLWRY